MKNNLFSRPISHRFPAWFNPARSSFCFDPDTEAQGGDGGASTMPGGVGGDTIVAGAGGDGGGARRTNEIASIAKARDKAKGAYRALLRTLNIDPESVTIVETGDAENPYRVEGIEDLAEVAAAARERDDTATGDQPKDKREIARRKRITLPFERRISTLQKRESALMNLVRDKLVRTEIRAAAREAHAIDDDGGQFADIVDLTEKRFKIEVQIDDDAEDPRDAARAIISTVDDLGEPLLDGDGNSLTAKDVVGELLKRKPKYRESNFVPGSGAGAGRANGNGIRVGTPGAKAARPTATPVEATRRAVGGFFGQEPAAMPVG